MDKNARRIIERVERSEEQRYTVFPISDRASWEAFKAAQGAFWTNEEIDGELAKDKADWDELDPKVQHFIKHILAFFAVSDGVVIETLTEEIMDRVKTMEIRMWYNFQIMMEDTHNVVYSKLIDTYIRDPKEKDQMFNSITHFPTIRKKINWVHRWIGKGKVLSKLPDKYHDFLIYLRDVYHEMEDVRSVLGAGPKNQIRTATLDKYFDELDIQRPSLAMLLLINVVMEGLFFSGSFCAIYWVKDILKKLPGLSKANEFISRDEGTHTDFGVQFYLTLEHPVEQLMVYQIFEEAVKIETEFIGSALPEGLLGMNADLMQTYVKFVADRLLNDLHYDPLFNVENPFLFMNKQSTSVRMSDFFIDRNISEYGHKASGKIATAKWLNLTDEF